MPVASNMRRTVKLRDTCDSCAQSKVKCNRGRPCCQRCLLRGLDCHYSPCRRLGRPGMSSPTTSSTSSESEVLEHTTVPDKTQNFAFVDDDYAGRPTLNISVDIDTPLSFAEPVEPMWLQPMNTPPAPWDFPMQDWPTPTDTSPSSATGPSSTGTSPLYDTAAEAPVTFPWPQFPSSPTCTTCAPRALAAFQSVAQVRGPSLARPSCRRRHAQPECSLPPSPPSPSLPEPGYFTTTTTTSNNSDNNNTISNNIVDSNNSTSAILHATASAITQVHAILSCNSGACAASDRAVTLLLLLICVEATHAYQRLARSIVFKGRKSHHRHHHQSAEDSNDGVEDDGEGGGGVCLDIPVSVAGYVPTRRRAQRKMMGALLLDELEEVARALGRIGGSGENDGGVAVGVGSDRDGKACGCTAATAGDMVGGRLTGSMGAQLREMMRELRGDLGAVLGLES